MKNQSGFALLALMVVMVCFMILYGFVSLNLIGTKQKADLNSTLATFVSDMHQQQIKTMTADTGTSGTVDDYGIFFQTNSYILFRGSSYSAGNPSNFSVNLGDNIQLINITFPSSQIILNRGSGEISSFNPNTNSITLHDTISQAEKTITFNRYGVITGIN